MLLFVNCRQHVGYGTMDSFSLEPLNVLIFYLMAANRQGNYLLMAGFPVGKCVIIFVQNFCIL